MIVYFDIMKAENVVERCHTLNEAVHECLFHCYDPVDDYYIKETFINEFGSSSIIFNTEGTKCANTAEAILGYDPGGAQHE